MLPKQPSSHDPPSSRRHSGNRVARLRLARNPKLRMRTKPGRQQMEQEAAQELIDSQSHEPFLVAVRGVAPAEGDVAIGESDQSAVGDGDAMGVGAEIAQHMFRPAEGPLGVDDPVVAEQHPQPCERRRAAQRVAGDCRRTGAYLDGMRCEVRRRTCRGRHG